MTSDSRDAIEDVVQALGYVTLGTRLKRLGEGLQAQAQGVLASAGIDVPSAQVPVLVALDRRGPLSVGDLTQAVGVTQPAVTRMVGKLERAGMISVSRGTGDRRVRTVALTAAGARVLEHARNRVWPRLEAAVADACDGTEGPLLAQVAALERALAAASLVVRAGRIGSGQIAARMLDRPVWATLNSHHAALSEGSAMARRFLPDINLWAAARDESDAALADLAALVRPGETVVLGQAPAVVTPAGLEVVKAARAVQMLATRPMPDDAGVERVIPLGDADAPEMLELATLTEPGPFLARTHLMGGFRGVRIGGRLVAMAGERLRFPGYTEISGVCTHPDCRGRGLARRLSAVVAAAIEARGETPFLHAWTTNAAAIALYERLGFRLRKEINVVVMTRRHASSPPCGDEARRG